jgi:hypothetical protein
VIGSTGVRKDKTSSLPWSPTTPSPPSNDPSEVLRRIERNTASLVGWVKVLVVAVVLLILVTALLFV